MVIGDGEVHEEDEFEFGVLELNCRVFQSFQQVDPFDQLVVFYQVIALLDYLGHVLVLELDSPGVGVFFFAKLVLGGGGGFFVFGGGLDGDGLGAG